MQAADNHEQLCLRVMRRGIQGISLGTLVAETGLTAETLRRRAASLVASGSLILCNGSDAHWIGSEALAQAAASAERELLAAGVLSRAELRSKTSLDAAVFPAVLQQLLASGKFEASGESVRVAGRRDDIPEPKRQQMQAIETIYAKAGLASPLLSEVAVQIKEPPASLRELITLLLRSKRLVRMGADDAFVHAHALAELYANLRKHRGESFDVARFKQFTGLTRKHAIPLLEHLNQARVTRNNGGTRTVL
jgi:selenocysteine-specific elongation factor